jgi:hypothetical protein
VYILAQRIKYSYKIIYLWTAVVFWKGRCRRITGHSGFENISAVSGASEAAGKVKKPCSFYSARLVKEKLKG